MWFNFTWNYQTVLTRFLPPDGCTCSAPVSVCLHQESILSPSLISMFPSGFMQSHMVSNIHFLVDCEAALFSCVRPMTAFQMFRNKNICFGAMPVEIWVSVHESFEDLSWCGYNLHVGHELCSLQYIIELFFLFSWYFTLQMNKSIPSTFLNVDHVCVSHAGLPGQDLDPESFVVSLPKCLKFLTYFELILLHKVGNLGKISVLVHGCWMATIVFHKVVSFLCWVVSVQLWKVSRTLSLWFYWLGCLFLSGSISVWLPQCVKDINIM